MKTLVVILALCIACPAVAEMVKDKELVKEKEIVLCLQHNQTYSSYQQFNDPKMDIGPCIGDCASEQGICISQCEGNGQCINNCAAAYGRCVARCSQ